MDWFKKFLQWFSDDNKNDTNTISRKRITRKINEGFDNKNGDIDARIYYQYPKGKFRFPVIPDEKVRPSRSSQERERTAENRSGSYRNENKKGMEATNKKSKTEFHHKKTNHHYGKPFKATEIPSPIYGFEQRKRVSKPVEVVLDDFVQEPVKEQDLPQNNISQWMVVEPEQVSAEKEVIENDTISSEMDMTNVEAVQFTTETMTETVTPEEKSTVKPQQQILEDEDENDDLFESDEMNHINPLPIKKDVSEEQDQQENDMPRKSEKGFLNKEHTLKSQEHNKNRKENIRPHIPFNVIMLSHDKKKLEERARAEKDRDGSKQSFYHDRVTSNKETAAAIEDKPSEQTKAEGSREEAHPFSKNSMSILVDQKEDDFNKRREGKLQKEEPVQEEDYHTEVEPYYVFPSMGLLKPPVSQHVNIQWLEEQKQLLNETLKNFNVGARVVNMTQGPSVTRFEVHPEPGVKVNKITNLSDDIKLSLAAKDIRIEAPIPGKHTIGIEVPNESRRPVFISEIIGSPIFTEDPSPLAAVLGLDISGKPIVTDLRKMPHGLIAGATGSGKSVCINSILVSLLYKANPADVKLLLIDPKMVELAPYNQIPHLVSPVITDVKAATAALKWAVEEMEHRYEVFAHEGVRDITRFNEVILREERFSEKLPYIVIIIDELADLMMVSPADVEEAICRIAQKARACGIHLIIATQRPSVDVITGLIKANVPTRIAFSVSSQVDSRTIIDISGAERLLGKGDMLFLENGTSKPVRLQGTFVTDEEIDAVVAHVRREQSPEYLFEQEELLKKELVAEEEDELFYDACEYIIRSGGASTSSLQRRFKIGYNRAARLIDMMEAQGFISESKGSKPRDVLITETELESIKGTTSL